ncbi:MAG: family helicase [Pseudomonadota bacterium]|jgi:superfamily II DNA or RNA helicase/HKD family nuclease
MALNALGLYEALITEGLSERLGKAGGNVHMVRDALRPPEVPDRIALHLSQVVERAMDLMPDRDRAHRGVELARQIINLINQSIDDDSFAMERPVAPGEVLRAVQRLLPDGSAPTLAAPLTPLLDTTLLTNAPHEPRVGAQILSELDSSDSIDVVMAFVRWSGIRPLLDGLRRHCADGRPVRLLTTTYTGSTELSALEALTAAGVDVRVSYETGSTRLHAKAWLFRRSSGYTTAYIGSSNLTHQAQVTGLEWNVRVSGARNPAVVRQVEAVFEAYWSSPDFRPFVADEFRALSETNADADIAFHLPAIELRLEPFQQRLLEQIELARSQGHRRNLLVSATGTGKTVMAAVDYLHLRGRLPRARLLFVAHREEILERSRATFRVALHDPAFGELWVGGQRPRQFEHVFASIQSLAHADLALTDPDHFDVVIIDEFHHAAAASYQRLLAHLRPRELLGLTATPERADGLSILEEFDGRIAAELRLWDAIDQQRLAPFMYFGVHDQLDLREVGWIRGRGYDIEQLTNVITADHMVAGRILQQLRLKVEDPKRMRALGFCVSVGHARFMAEQFTKAGVSALAVWSDTPDDERRAALRLLAEGKLNILFTVDLFNEGIDIPAVDTLLMLRPTESGTLFLQQLGRGLRRSAGKPYCTVLDFVSQHRQEFRYEARFRALLGGRRQHVVEQIEQGFPFLPAGCHMELDPVAMDVVLKSIRSALPRAHAQRVAALAQWKGGRAPRLREFLEETGLELSDVLGHRMGWSGLLAAAGFSVAAAGPLELGLRAAVGRLQHIDDPERVALYEAWLAGAAPPNVSQLSTRHQRLLRMMVVSLVETPLAGKGSVEDGLRTLWEHPQVIAEMLELLDVLKGTQSHVTPDIVLVDEPLRLHASYSRLEILSAMNLGDGVGTPLWNSGVFWVGEARADLFTITLDKSGGRFSPTTRYRDYAISRDLFHWESQSRTRSASDIGHRYQNHQRLGSRVLLFARRTPDERAYYFLGPADYVSHEGDAPMGITWRLHHPLTEDLFADFAAAVT